MQSVTSLVLSESNRMSDNLGKKSGVNIIPDLVNRIDEKTVVHPDIREFNKIKLIKFQKLAYQPPPCLGC